MRLTQILNYQTEVAVYWASYLVVPVLLALLFYWKKHKILFSFFIILCLLFCWARFVEPRMLVVNNLSAARQDRQDAQSEAVEQPLGLKIAIASDMHYGLFKNNVSLKRVVSAINRGKPDLVLLPGDFVFQAKKETIAGMFAELKNLQAPTFAVLGNHDVGPKGEIDVEEEITAELAQYATLLKNEKAVFEKDNKKINIIGLSDLLEQKPDFTLLQGLNQNEFNLALTHNPDSAYYFPENIKVNLVVAGHTHGGQVRLPFLYKIFLPSDFGMEKGFYNVKGNDVFITSGVGFAGLPFRFLMPPEIVFLEI